MLEQMKELLRTMLKDEELFDLMAKVNMMYFEALMNQGFRREEAVEICARQGTSGN